jgi:hypothetical protein
MVVNSSSAGDAAILALSSLSTIGSASRQPAVSELCSGITALLAF